MFDEVTKQEGGKRAARRSAFLLGSTGVQIAAVFAIIVISAAVKSAKGDNDIPVNIVGPKRGAPPPPPPPPPKKKKSQTKKTVQKKPTNPTAIIQPKEVPQDLTPPSSDDDDDDGVEGGVEGGVAGGVVGGVVGGVLGGQLGGTGTEEAPQYVTSGFKKPELDNKNCVKESVRIPPDLRGIVSRVVVQFAVRPDGSTGLFQFKTQVPDKRIEDAIKKAISGCTWKPGSDAQGKAVSLWVILPLALQGG